MIAMLLATDHLCLTGLCKVDPCLMSTSVQAICSGAMDLLAPNGFLALEVGCSTLCGLCPICWVVPLLFPVTLSHPGQTHGADQAPLVAELLRRTSKFREVKVVDDCFGVPRFVRAERGALEPPQPGAASKANGR
jgi:methylase of polypeptide subunit release factors